MTQRITGAQIDLECYAFFKNALLVAALWRGYCHHLLPFLNERGLMRNGQYLVLSDIFRICVATWAFIRPLGAAAAGEAHRLLLILDAAAAQEL